MRSPDSSGGVDASDARGDRLEFLSGVLRAKFESRSEVGNHSAHGKLRDMRLVEPIVREAVWTDEPVVRGDDLFDDTLVDGLSAARVLTNDGIVREVERLEDVRLSQVSLTNVHKLGERLVGDIEARVTAVRRIVVPPPTPPPVVLAPSVQVPVPTLTAEVQEFPARDSWKTPPSLPAVDRVNNSALDNGVGCLTKSTETVIAMLIFGVVALAALWLASAVFSFVYDILIAAWDRTGIGSVSPDVFPAPVSGWARWWGQHIHPLGQILIVVVAAYVLFGWKKFSRWRWR